MRGTPSLRSSNCFSRKVEDRLDCAMLAVLEVGAYRLAPLAEREAMGHQIGNREVGAIGQESEGHVKRVWLTLKRVLAGINVAAGHLQFARPNEGTVEMRYLTG